MTAVALAELLHTKKRGIHETLNSLRSVLDDPESQGFHIRLLHPTFGDFLLDHQSCDNNLFSIDREKAHRDLFTDCLELMSQHLKADNCDLRLPGTLMSEVDKLEVERHVSLAVQYACRHLVDHLQRANVQLHEEEPFHDQVYTFLKEHFVHWLETLSLIEKISDDIVMIKAFESFLWVSNLVHWTIFVSFWSTVVSRGASRSRFKATTIRMSISRKTSYIALSWPSVSVTTFRVFSSYPIFYCI
jgi:hypothetical protein